MNLVEQQLDTIANITYAYAADATVARSLEFGEAHALVHTWLDIRATYIRALFWRGVIDGLTWGPIRRAFRRFLRRHA